MKTLVVTSCGIMLLGLLGICCKRPAGQAEQKPLETETAVEEPSSGPSPQKPALAAPLKPVIARNPEVATPAMTVQAPSPDLAVDTSYIRSKVDVLVSREKTFAEKQQAWKELRSSGKLDQAISELEKRMAAYPQQAEYAASLGQAYLQKCGMLQDVREQGILAMQADKTFDIALNLDPANWEARFTKAVAMSYWPPMLNKGEEVIKHFQTLIEQQETQPSQPQFADTYSWLGDQYRRAGRTNDAVLVWQRGLSLFPEDEKLRNKVTSTPF